MQAKLLAAAEAFPSCLPPPVLLHALCVVQCWQVHSSSLDYGQGEATQGNGELLQDLLKFREPLSLTA